MGDFFAGWRYALRRLRTGWRFMAVAAFGVLVAATLLAITPIYAAAMSDLGLQFRLDRELEGRLDSLAYMAVDDLAMADPVDRATGQVVDRITDARIGWLGSGVLAEDRTQRLNISFPDHQAPEEPVEVPAGGGTVRQPWGGFVYHLPGWEDAVEVVEGRMPDDGSPTPEAVLPDGFQRHAALGDVVLLQAGGYDDCPDIPPSEDVTTAAEEVICEPTATTSMSLRVAIVGFVRPLDADDPRWAVFDGQWEAPDVPLIPRLRGVGAQDPRRAQAARGIGQMPLLTTQEQFDGAFRRGLPELTYRHTSGVNVDTARVGLGDVDAAIGEMQLWLSDVQRLGITPSRNVDVLETLEGFRNAQSFSAVPLLVVLLQVVGIVLYYVAMVMAMLLERQSEEIGVFRSRGASSTQLVGLSLVEGLVYAVPALLVAPWLAARVVSLLGSTPVFDSVTGGAALEARVTPEAYLLAVAGGALSLIAILLPALFAVRRGIVDVKREQARPAERSLFQRYYLDFALVALAALLLWQLDQRGSVFDPGSVGGWSSDPLLLLAPVAITAAVSLMVLRFYPPLVRLTVRVLLVFRSTATAIGLRRAGRAPASYARVALLVIMAVAVGTFAASYGPTVALSLADRARYETGVDLQGPVARPVPGVDAQIAALGDRPGVEAASGVYRGVIHSPRGTQIPLLAIDPAMAQEALWWRDDFATRDLDALMRLLQSDIPPGGGYPLPEDAQAIEFRVYSPRPERASFVARFRDADGVIRDSLVDMDGVAPDTWLPARAATPDFGTPPFVFAGFLVSDRPVQNLRVDGELSIDNLDAVLRDGRRERLEDFEGPMRWMMLGGVDADETFEVNPDLGVDDGQSLTWSWSSTISTRQRVLAPGDPAIPLSVLMNGPAMGEFGTAEGGAALAEFGPLLIPLAVRAQVDLFPTLLPEQGIVIVNIHHLRAAAALTGLAAYESPNEVWADLAPSMSLSDQSALLASLQGPGGEPRLTFGASLLDVRVDGTDSDPTLQAAGSAILGVAFVAVLALCTVGFVVTMVTGARSRATEFAVLRALGTSRGEILRALIVEWTVVLAAGAVIGALVGRQVARIMLGFLNVTETGDPVLPPFELRTDWLTLAMGLGALVGIVGVSLVAAWIASMRRAPTGELRLTQ